MALCNILSLHFLYYISHTPQKDHPYSYHILHKGIFFLRRDAGLAVIAGIFLPQRSVQVAPREGLSQVDISVGPKHGRAANLSIIVFLCVVSIPGFGPKTQIPK